MENFNADTEDDLGFFLRTSANQFAGKLKYSEKQGFQREIQCTYWSIGA